MMDIDDKFPNAHPDFYKAYRDMREVTQGVDVFFVMAAAHEVMAMALAQIAKNHPDWKAGLAEQLRLTADWCEFMPADAMCGAMTNDEIPGLIDKHRFDPE